jgi:hypothetical protein
MSGPALGLHCLVWVRLVVRGAQSLLGLVCAACIVAVSILLGAPAHGVLGERYAGSEPASVKVVESATATGSITSSYDTSGPLSSRPSASAFTSITWNSWSLPATVTKPPPSLMTWHRTLAFTSTPPKARMRRSLKLLARQDGLVHDLR